MKNGKSGLTKNDWLRAVALTAAGATAMVLGYQAAEDRMNEPAAPKSLADSFGDFGYKVVAPLGTTKVNIAGHDYDAECYKLRSTDPDRKEILRGCGDLRTDTLTIGPMPRR
jgi:hypothetical protein